MNNNKNLLEEAHVKIELTLLNTPWQNRKHQYVFQLSCQLKTETYDVQRILCVLPFINDLAVLLCKNRQIWIENRQIGKREILLQKSSNDDKIMLSGSPAWVIIKRSIPKELEMSSSERRIHFNLDRNAAIREDIECMTFEQVVKLKEELGTKVYKEAILGAEYASSSTSKEKFKRLNKNRPREKPSKLQVPFLGLEKQKLQKDSASKTSDPRFDEETGVYNTKKFKDNYKFLTDIRQKEIQQWKKQLRKSFDEGERKQIKQAIEALVNKNLNEKKWHKKHSMLQMEKEEFKRLRAERSITHFVAKKERRAKELVEKFEQLQRTGKLGKHLEKRRKKNVAKDRKKLKFV